MRSRGVQTTPASFLYEVKLPPVYPEKIQNPPAVSRANRSAKPSPSTSSLTTICRKVAGLGAGAEAR